MLDTGSFLTIFSIKAVVIKNDKKPPVAEIRAVAKIDINESFFSYFYTLALRVLWDFLSDGGQNHFGFCKNCSVIIISERANRITTCSDKCRIAWNRQG